jgi:hypothetical protein
MAGDAQRPRYAGVRVQSNKFGAVFYTSSTWPAVVLERCRNRKIIWLGTFKTEEEAASAVDQ